MSETVYMIGAQDNSGWDYLLEKYGVSMCETEKSKFLSALANSRDSEKLSRYTTVITHSSFHQQTFPRNPSKYVLRTFMITLHLRFL